MIYLLRTPKSFGVRSFSNRTFSSRAITERITLNDEDYRYTQEPYFYWYEDFEQITETPYTFEDYGDLT